MGYSKTSPFSFSIHSRSDLYAWQEALICYNLYPALSYKGPNAKDNNVAYFKNICPKMRCKSQNALYAKVDETIMELSTHIIFVLSSSHANSICIYLKLQKWIFVSENICFHSLFHDMTLLVIPVSPLYDVSLIFY